VDVGAAIPRNLEAMTLAIEIEGLSKTFGTTTALDGLDLSVTEGEVHGFLGPNGAGKSTTIRILLGLLKADAGSAKLLGGDPWRQGPELHRRLAYVPGDVSLWPNLSGGEVIDLLGRLRGGLVEPAGQSCLNASSATPPKGAGPIPRETVRRSCWWPRSPQTSSCSCSTNRPRVLTR
jgi:ABC-2 type transport system ATP-binding protein